MFGTNSVSVEVPAIEWNPLVRMCDEPSQATILKLFNFSTRRLWMTAHRERCAEDSRPLGSFAQKDMPFWK